MNILRLPQKIITGLAALLRRDRVERDMDEELRGYLDLSAKHKMESGMGHDEAVRAARVELGSVSAVKDGIRSAGWESTLDTAWQDVRYAVRILAKNRAFTAVAVLTLALGIGANTAIFSLIDSIVLRTLPVSRAEELAQIRIRDPRFKGDGSQTFTNPLWEQVRQRQDVFSSIFAWNEVRFDLARGGAVQYVNGLWVSGNFFNSLQVGAAAGRLIADGDDKRGCPPVAVLSYEFWRSRYGGAQNAVGSIISLSNHPVEIIGVAAEGFHGVNVGKTFDVAIPICSSTAFDTKRSRLDQRSWWWLSIIGRVKPDVTLAQVNARLNVLSPQVFAEALPQDWSPAMQNGFRKKWLVASPAASGISALRRQFDRPLQVLMMVVGLVLLIACANVASLMLARGAARHKEIALRQALGASRTRLVLQLLTECLLLSCSGAVIGILFARWGASQLVRYLSTDRSTVFLDLSMNMRALAFTATIAVLTGILFGLLPALRSTRISLNSAMKTVPGSRSEGHARPSTRKWIVASQVALSLVLLVAAGLLLRSFSKLASLDIGFDRNNVLLVNTNFETAKVPAEQQPGLSEAIENRLRTLPGVVSAARSVVTPISGGTWNNNIRTDWTKSLTGDQTLTWFNYVSPSYFETMRMVLLAGRGLNDRDTGASTKVVILNQTAARRYFPGVDPLGKTITIDEISGKPGAPIEVVGIIKDAKYESIREETLPTAFFPVRQLPERTVAGTFEVRTAIPPSALGPAVQAAVGEINKDLPLEFRTLARQVDDSLVQERMLALLSGFFGVLALLLAMIGLYGTLSYLVMQRQTEFGVRMALGAQRNEIMSLVMRDVFTVLAGGVVAGVCISLVATRLLSKMLFGLGARDLTTMIIAVGVLAVVALAAGYLPARRATRVDPMVALRYE